MDLGDPAPILAALALVALLFLAPARKRFSPTYLISAIGGAAGFLLSGWVGLLTVCLAFTYRALKRLRAPWQALLSATIGLATFAGAALALDSFALTNTTSTDANKPDGAWQSFTHQINTVATNRTLLLSLLVCSSLLTLVFLWRMYMHSKYPYRNLGLEANAEMMYRGVINRNLVTLPEAQRDPQRSFSAKVRKDKLDDQEGVCAYQTQIPQHPRWEPYRSGVQWEGDHIIPWAAGGATNYENLQVLCADCNSAKSDAYGKKAMKKIERRWNAKS